MRPTFLPWSLQSGILSGQTRPRLPFKFQLGLWVACVSGIAHAGFAPIPLTSSSFNQDVVVERTAATPVRAGGYTPASMDNGLANTVDTRSHRTNKREIRCQRAW